MDPLMFDRMETAPAEDGGGLACLSGRGGRALRLPSGALPQGAKPGDVLALDECGALHLDAQTARQFWGEGFYVLDAAAEGRARLEEPSGAMGVYPAACLPEGAAEGDVMAADATGHLAVDEAETQRRRKAAADRLRALLGRH